MNFLLPTLAFTVLAGCTELSVVSTRSNEGQTAELGIPYSLPISMVKLDLKQTEKAFEVVGPTVQNVADKDHRFFLTYQPSVLASDTHKFTVGSNGLLNAIDATTEDQSVGITNSVTDLLASVAVRNKNVARTDTPEPLKTFHRILFFDPRDVDSIEAAQETLEGTGVKLFVSPKVENAAANGRRTVVPFASNEAATVPVKRSVYFRSTVPMTIKVKNNAASYDAVFPITVADKSSYVAMDIRRAACVKKDTNLTFLDGMISSLKVVKPSELAGCLAIPSKIIQSVIALPNGRRTALKAALDSQKAVIDAQNNLIKSQAALEETQEENNP